MINSSFQYQRQVIADRHDQLRREAGASRLRRDARRRLKRLRPGPSR